MARISPRPYTRPHMRSRLVQITTAILPGRAHHAAMMRLGWGGAGGGICTRELPIKKVKVNSAGGRGGAPPPHPVAQRLSASVCPGGGDHIYPVCLRASLVQMFTGITLPGPRAPESTHATTSYRQIDLPESENISNMNTV